MNQTNQQKEQEIDNIIDTLESDKSMPVPPIFELAITTFSTLLTITLFIYTDMLSTKYNVYEVMLQVASQTTWTIGFFVACLFKSLGLLLSKNFLRIIGLALSSVLYFIISIAYAIDFPNMSAILYGVLALFSVISMQQVKFTSIVSIEKE